jgi:hypothetical protein
VFLIATGAGFDLGTTGLGTFLGFGVITGGLVCNIGFGCAIGCNTGVCIMGVEQGLLLPFNPLTQSTILAFVIAGNDMESTKHKMKVFMTFFMLIVVNL